MRQKTRFFAVPIGDTDSEPQYRIIHLHAVKLVSSDWIDHNNLTCANCHTDKLSVIAEFVQHGWLDDRHELIAYCSKCEVATCYRYIVENES